mmetsp:Transcript_10407/g.28765  ORF Transcript_10407/g.28765 Transcript_10407/m.28765 type:complete len:216 (-) Transcript_10407:22-669(-)
MKKVREELSTIRNTIGKFTMLPSFQPSSSRLSPIMNLYTYPSKRIPRDIWFHIKSFPVSKSKHKTTLFFRRIWTVRHVLDANSPLLTTAARDLVNSCGGLWPKDVTTAKYVRHAVNFDQLLVSFSGTSNADANTVYAQKVYDYDALNIGFRFVNMLYRDRMSGRVQVDLSLINDVRTQDGGGAENLYNPLGDTDSVERKLNHLAHSGSIRDMISI